MRIAKIEYGFGVPLTVLLSNGPLSRWRISPRGDGGADVAASGIPEAFEIREDNVVEIRWPFLDTSYAEVMEWFRWAQRNVGTPFLFSFDTSEIDTQYEVYLHSPLLGEGGFEPEPDNYQPLWWLAFQLRTVDGMRFTTTFTD